MIETLRLYYKILLNRDMNQGEIERTVRMLESLGDKDFNIAEYRESIIKSPEFCHANRELFYGSLFPRSTIVVAKTPLGQDIYVDIRELHLGGSIAQGHFEVPETNFVKRSIQRGYSICDIGANVGYFTLMFGALAGPTGSVIAFEPVSNNFERLTASIDLNRLRHIIKPMRAAVSNQPGSLEMVSHLNSLNSGASHIRSDEANSPGQIIERVDCVTLDDVVGGRHVDFIKIDIEGAEYLAMQGAEKTLRQCKPVIMMEFNEDQLRRISSIGVAAMLDYMTSFGYAVHEIERDGSTTPVANIAEALPRLLGKSRIFNTALLPA